MTREADVSFGEAVRPADDVDAARWIGRARLGSPGTVGALLPNSYEAFLRVSAPDPCEGWWSFYRELFSVFAEVGASHTTSPDRAWIGIWEGHGFDKGSTRIAHLGPRDDESAIALERQREAMRDADRQRHASVRRYLSQIPRFELPHRTYYLLRGKVGSVRELRYPGFEGWRNPDLFWPGDRRWFVATDVDFWSVYVGGDRAFIDVLATSVPTRSEEVGLAAPTPIED